MTTTSRSPSDSSPGDDAETLAWVAAAQARDEQAFARLYAQCAPRVYQLLVRLAGDEVAAADLLQDTFIQAWRGLPAWRGDSRLATWLHQIARRAWLQQVRTRERRAAHEVAMDELDALAGIATPARDPLLQVDLARAIAALPPRMRTAFVLHDLEGLSFEAIAHETGTAAGTVRTQVARARAILLRAVGP